MLQKQLTLFKPKSFAKTSSLHRVPAVTPTGENSIMQTLPAYRAHLSQQYAAKTVSMYVGDIRELSVYLSGHPLQEVTPTDLEQWIETLLSETGRHLERKTLNRKISAVGNYFVNSDLVAKKNPDGSKVYYHNDSLGSTSLLTNQSGTVVENTSYYPFGQIRAGGTQSKYLYTGQENDAETSLDYYNARYYDPSINHFTQPDTELPDIYDPQQLNRYAYVRNNPMTKTDPTGHCPVCFVAAGIGVLAGVGTQYIINPHSSLTDYGKAALIGGVSGLVAPASESIVAETVIAGLAKTTLSVTARTTVGDLVGTGVTSYGINTTKSVVNGDDPAKDLPTKVGSDMLASYLTDGIIPMGGRTPSLINPVRFGPNSLKQVGRQEVGDAMSSVLENTVNNALPSATFPYVLYHPVVPYISNYNQSDAKYTTSR